MIIYNQPLAIFKNDVILNMMQDILLNTLKEKGISGGSPSEINSWNNSLHFMKDVLDDDYFSKECGIVIEYNIPQTSKRIDFMVIGNNGDKDHIVIVELKQWLKLKK